jgi:hypothetical protein
MAQAEHMSGQESLVSGVRFNTTVPNVARIYDYFLGGKDNFPADRQAGDRLAKELPGIERACRDNRDFLQRAVRYLAGQGIRQFLDIGTGLPTMGSVHAVAQEAAPGARVAYVDYDRCKSGCAHACLGRSGCLRRTWERSAQSVPERSSTPTATSTNTSAYGAPGQLYWSAHRDEQRAGVHHQGLNGRARRPNIGSVPRRRT